MMRWIKAAVFAALAEEAHKKIWQKGEFYVDWYFTFHHLVNAADKAAGYEPA